MDKPGFERRSEGLRWSAHAAVEKWTPEQVASVRKMLGYEPSTEDLERFYVPEVTEAGGNLLTTAGLNRLTARFIGVSVQAADNTHTRLGVGNDTTAASVGQTDLQAASGAANRQYKTMDATYPTQANGVLTFKSTFASGEANFVWNEWGIDIKDSGSAADGTTVNDVLINRKVASLGTKVSGAVWALTVTITIS